MSCGPTERHARASPGTVVVLKDMYHSVSLGFCILHMIRADTASGPRPSKLYTKGLHPLPHPSMHQSRRDDDPSLFERSQPSPRSNTPQHHTHSRRKSRRRDPIEASCGNQSRQGHRHIIRRHLWRRPHGFLKIVQSIRSRHSGARIPRLRGTSNKGASVLVCQWASYREIRALRFDWGDVYDR